ncbi:hypothetical protein LshimejAT787_0306530 [Lyophyllum shimeji]|uniref:Uncharacterized protein n=1 Tax=Lyophyllum shimeji TaxID=47721 RepID=A0A9P3PI38_LYOSH|nr:hypothetical protein LshimejAT787_0306530 [Lyophyllum shimeji]
MQKFILLQDLVKSQNDQLLRIRRLVDETMFRNDLLLDELDRVRQEVDREGASPVSESSVERSVEPSRVAERSYLNEVDVASNAPASSNEVKDDPMSVADEDEHENLSTSALGEEAAMPFVPFCSKEGPFKYLDRAKKALRSAGGSPVHRLLVARDELIFDDERRVYGILVTPQHKYIVDSEGNYEQRPFEKNKRKKLPEPVREVICGQGPDFFYLGTYEITFSKALDATEFEKLPERTRREIYRLTSDSVKKVVRELKLPHKYMTGDLQASQMECRRVGFNEEFNRYLFEAAGRPVGTRGSPASCLETDPRSTPGIGNEHAVDISIEC